MYLKRFLGRININLKIYNTIEELAKDYDKHECEQYFKINLISPQSIKEMIDKEKERGEEEKRKQEIIKLEKEIKMLQNKLKILKDKEANE